MYKRILILLFLVFWALPALAQVDTAWVRRYNGPGNYVDEACAIAVDDSGNVYVTGDSYGSGTDYDYATIKYYPNGDTAWVRRYHGPVASGWDIANAMAIDGSGNVYVTGHSQGSGGAFDYLTIKYHPNGDTAWLRRYNGPQNGYDRASAITLDSLGNVYVTGGSEASGVSYDYATIKYDPNGDTLWLRRYNGVDNWYDAYDFANAVALDGSGNVYVTGSSRDTMGGDDCATIKYYPNGDTAWVRRYNGPASSADFVSDMAVNSSGNVYVTGSSIGVDSKYHYFTIKYYPNGDTAWVRRYNDPGDGHDYAHGIVVDGSGNVYVTGASYDSVTNDDFATIKYDSSGNELWVQRYNGPANDEDGASAMALDSSGNIYVTGSSRGWAHFDYLTIKYYPNGDTAWVRTYNGPGSSYDEAYAIAVDATDNVYVTGKSYSDETIICDYATIKYVQYEFLRGDANRDGKINSADSVYLINYFFAGGPAPNPLWVGDANCDGTINIADVVFLINYLFANGPPPSC